MKELLTASRMNTFNTCSRRHYWRYEVGLRKEEAALPLRFGSAWHRAMEARWQGKDAVGCWQAACDGTEELDPYETAKLGAMLTAYIEHPPYAQGDEFMDVTPEVEFHHRIERSRTFEAAGKIDGLLQLRDGRLAILEHKTTASSVAPDSDYWLRLRADTQIRQYVLAAREKGWDVAYVLYDVVRKPGIRPKQIPRRDENGYKIVVSNKTGERVFLRNGEKPRQSAGKDMTLQTDPETPEEYGDRLEKDIKKRPEFYFGRREVPVLDGDLEEFEDARIQVSRMILDRRRQQKKMNGTPERAWPRYVSGILCPGCEYAGFCLQNIVPDTNHLPAGYEMTRLHTELERGTTNE